MAAPAWGQASQPSRVRLTWENDIFAGRDGHYTNGAAVALSGRLDPHQLPAPFDADDGEWEITVGQQIYTPEDTSIPDLIRDDRPYAGYAYVSFSAIRRDRGHELEDRITLSLGVVGPTARAEEAYDLAHDLTGSSLAEGWAHQLRDEPAVGLRYGLSARLARVRALGLDADLSADAEVALGNVATYGSTGGTLRVGLNVPDEFTDDAPAPLHLYLTATAKLRAVAYDIFLDGNLLRSGGHSVRRHPLVAELAVGLTFAVSEQVSFSYVHTYRTPQFHGQRQGDQFGSFSLVVSW